MTRLRFPTGRYSIFVNCKSSSVSPMVTTMKRDGNGDQPTVAALASRH